MLSKLENRARYSNTIFGILGLILIACYLGILTCILLTVLNSPWYIGVTVVYFFLKQLIMGREMPLDK